MNWLNFLEILHKLRGKNEKINITETEKATKSNRSKQILRKIILRSHTKIVWSRVVPKIVCLCGPPPLPEWFPRWQPMNHTSGNKLAIVEKGKPGQTVSIEAREKYEYWFK